nr:hypothetical protein [Tanacetum cinerariifolium]
MDSKAIGWSAVLFIVEQSVFNIFDRGTLDFGNIFTSVTTRISLLMLDFLDDYKHKSLNTIKSQRRGWLRLSLHKSYRLTALQSTFGEQIVNVS